MHPARQLLMLLAPFALAACGALHTALSDSAWRSEDQVVDFHGDRINLLRGGRGDTEIAFVHGNPGYGDEAWPHQQQLEREYRWLRWDRPGHGASSRHARWSVADQADLLDRLLDKGPAILVAHSAGAAIALQLAIDHPDRVRGLVLVAPVTRAEPADDDGALYAVPVLGAIAQETIGTPLARLAVAPAALRRAWNGTRGPDLTDDERLRPLFERGVSQFVRPTEVKATWYDDVAVADAYTQLRGAQYRVQQPVVVLVGDDDPVVDARYHANLFRWCRPDTALVTVPGGHHMLHLTHPALVAAAVRQVDRQARGEGRADAEAILRAADGDKRAD